MGIVVTKPEVITTFTCDHCGTQEVHKTPNGSTPTEYLPNLWKRAALSTFEDDWDFVKLLCDECSGKVRLFLNGSGEL